MDSTSKLWILLAVLILIFAAAYFIIKKQLELQKVRTDKRGAQKVARVLNQIAGKKSNQYQVIHDISLFYRGKIVPIDHIVIGSFGVAVVETIALNGEIFGNQTDREWTHITGDKRKRFENPLLQTQKQVDAVRAVLKQAQIYRVDVENLVVFSQKTAILNLPRKLPVITIDQLKKRFKKSRYRHHHQVNKQRVHDALLDAKATQSC